MHMGPAVQSPIPPSGREFRIITKQDISKVGEKKEACFLLLLIDVRIAKRKDILTLDNFTNNERNLFYTTEKLCAASRMQHT
jgi:hypothetical protein